MRWLVLAAGDGGSFTDINIKTALWTWAAFAVTFVVLSKVAWPAITTRLEERELRIAEGLRKAEEAEARARQLMEQRARVLAESRKEAQQLIAAAREAAEQDASGFVVSAQQELAEERRRARQEVAADRAKATEELKQAAVDLTLLASSRVIGRDLSGQNERRLAGEIVEELSGARHAAAA